MTIARPIITKEREKKEIPRCGSQPIIEEEEQEGEIKNKEQEGNQHLIAMLMAASCIRAVLGFTASLCLPLSCLPPSLSLYVIWRGSQIYREEKKTVYDGWPKRYLKLLSAYWNFFFFVHK